MDEQRFDDLTRMLGSTETRRRAIKMFNGGGLAMLLARLNLGESEAACRKAKKPCKRDQQCCSGRCKKDRCKGNGAPIEDICEGQDIGTPCGSGCSCLQSASGALECGDPSTVFGCNADAVCASTIGPGSFCFTNKDGESQCAAPCPDPN